MNKFESGKARDQVREVMRKKVRDSLQKELESGNLVMIWEPNSMETFIVPKSWAIERGYNVFQD